MYILTKSALIMPTWTKKSFTCWWLGKLAFWYYIFYYFLFTFNQQVKDFLVHVGIIKADFVNMYIACSISCVFAEAYQILVWLSHSVHYLFNSDGWMGHLSKVWLSLLHGDKDLILFERRVLISDPLPPPWK